MNLRELLPRLSGVRRGGQGFVAKCPTHNDEKQSLSLAEDQGRVLIKCFAGCETKSIVDKLGITWQDLFDKKIKQPSSTSLGQSDTRRVSVDDAGYSPLSRRIHQVYKYVDEAGKVLYENVRYYPKSFRQRGYNEKGEWIWNLEGVRRVPYCLPELIKAKENNADIFLCEGEKDADVLRELGFTASSFKNWTEDFNQYIHGCHVVIVQDHDTPGITMANEAARLVLRSAASVKVLDVFADRVAPDNHGFDISDYIKFCVQDEGLDADQLKERLSLMIEQTDLWRDSQSKRVDDYFVVQSGNEWMAKSKSQPVPKKLFGEFWFENELCILFADTNVGKSILAVQIADQISRSEFNDGRLKTESVAQKVVYFDFELTSKQFESRFSERQDGSDEFVNHYEFHRNFYRAEINPELLQSSRTFSITHLKQRSFPQARRC